MTSQGRSYITVTIFQSPHIALIDSGANCSVCSQSFYEKFLSALPLDTSSKVVINGITHNNNKVYSQGKVVVPFLIDSYLTSQTFLVVPHMTHDLILGCDWLTDTQNANIDLQSQILTLRPKSDLTIKVQMHAKDIVLEKKRVVLDKKLTLPPRSEMIVCCTIKGPGSGTHYDGTVGITTRYLSLLEKKGIMSGSCICKVEGGSIPVRILNANHESVELWPNETVAYFEPEATIYATNLSDLTDGIAATNNSSTSNSVFDVSTLDLGSDMDDTQRDQMLQLLKRYSHVFATELSQLGTCDLIKYDIKTTGEPVKQSPYRTNPIQREQIDNHIKDLLKAKLIKPCNSSWSSPILLVDKPDGSTRFCVDYRKLNLQTIKDAGPIGNCQEIFDNLAYNCPRWMCLIDGKSGYSSMPLTDEAMEKAAFVTYNSQYCPTRLPFGLCNAPALFTKLMKSVLDDLPLSICLLYLDDVVVMAQSFKELLKNLELVLERYSKHNLKLNPKKCYFGRREIPFLGNYVSEKGFRTNPAKIEVVKKFPLPEDTDDPKQSLHSFLGLAVYYAKYIPNFAILSSCLWDLFKKDVKWEWTRERNDNFLKIKELLINSPILAFPRFTEKFQLHTDGSRTAIGVVLTQIQDGEERVIGYSGRQLSATERAYNTSEIECLAILHGLRAFHTYLSSVPFEIYTDHSCLRYLMSGKLTNARLERWAIKIASYNCVIKHRRGSKHGNCDSISRFPYDFMDIKESPIDEEQALEGDLLVVDSPLDSITPAEFLDLQKADSFCKPYIDYILDGVLPDDDRKAKNIIMESVHYDIIDDRLFRLGHPNAKHLQSIKMLCIPSVLQPALIKAVHSNLSLGGGHFGFDKTYSNLKASGYYFPRMASQTYKVCKNCEICQLRKGSPKKRAHMVSMRPVTRSNERVCLDFAYLPESTDACKYVLLFVDTMTHRITLFPCRDMTARTVAACLLRYCATYGPIETLVTDFAANLRTEMLNEFYSLWGTKHLTCAPYNPSADASERQLRTVKGLISMFCKNRRTWSTLLPCLEYALNVCPSPNTTAFSAWYLTFGRHPLNVPSQFQFGVGPDGTPNLCNYAEQTAEALNSALKLASENAESYEKTKVHQYNRLVMKSNLIPFQPGSLVYLYIGNRYQSQSDRGHRKVADRWRGPLTVTEVLPSGVDYRLRCVKTHALLPSVYHRNQLKPGYCYLGQYTDSPPTDAHPSVSGPDQPFTDVNEQNEKANEEADKKLASDKLPDGWYAVKKVLKSCYVPRTKSRIYQVRWVDPPTTSWVRAEDLSQDLIDAFHSVNAFYASKRKAKLKFP